MPTKIVKPSWFRGDAAFHWKIEAIRILIDVCVSHQDESIILLQ